MTPNEAQGVVDAIEARLDPVDLAEWRAIYSALEGARTTQLATWTDPSPGAADLATEALDLFRRRLDAFNAKWECKVTLEMILDAERFMAGKKDDTNAA